MAGEGNCSTNAEEPIQVGSQEQEDPSSVESDPQRRFQRYDEQIAEGRFKTVYRGYDTENGIDVAWCKVRREDIQTLKITYTYIKKGLAFDHPNIIHCFQCWMDSHNQCINLITELFTSGTLRQYRETYSNLDINVHRKYLRQILHGLQYLHSREPPIVHTDIRLDKIYVNGFNGEVKLGDLGLGTLVTEARQCHHHHPTDIPSKSKALLTDLFAVGVCAYELNTGVQFDRSHQSVSIIREIQQSVKVRDPDAKDFILACLSMNEDLTAEALLQHSFLKSKSTGTKLRNGVEWEESRYKAQQHKNLLTKLRGEDVKFEFRGYKSPNEDGQTVHIRLIMSKEAETEHLTTLDFDYNLETDTPESVGGDIADSFALSITDRELCKAALREWLSVMDAAEDAPDDQSTHEEDHQQPTMAANSKFKIKQAGEETNNKKDHQE